MRKLTALRPIQYMGRTYTRGAALPVTDAGMLRAWLKAGSAAWAEAAAEPAACIPVPDEALRQAGAVLEALGVELREENGAFVGAEALTEQLRLLGQELAQDFEAVLPPVPEALAAGALPGEESAAETGGRFSLTNLSRMTRAELENLAAELETDISGCRTNAERAEALAGLAEVEKASPEETA